MPSPVTDPNILAQLDGPQAISDPAILAQLGEAPRGAIDKLLGSTGQRYQTWPERLARGLGSQVKDAVMAPGDAMAGKFDPESPEGTRRAMGLAALATPVSPRSALTATPRVGPPTGAELLETGGKQIESARTSPVDIAPQALNTWADATKIALDRAGSSAENAPRVHAILDRALKPAPGSATVTPDNLISLRRTLQGQAQNFNDAGEQLAASRAIKSLDGFISAPPAGSVLAGDAAATGALYAEGRGNYAAGKRSETVNEARQDAVFSAAAANSGKNLGNRERQTFNSIRGQDKEISGFSPAEVQQIEQNIIMGTGPMNSARNWSNRLGGGGGAGQMLTAGLGGGAGAMLMGDAAGAGIGATLGAAILPTAGAVTRALANRLTNQQVNKLDEMVRGRSPLAELLASAPKQMTPTEQIKQSAVLKALLEGPQTGP